ncbi:hypothetical protein FOWG_10654 [Fusarium oxysporum f. sp. lycopersici MN25]|nr:hypothetical protein FOWG_10654 [Fusarium oxysporum f. sp. lycopersici MN25]
MFPLFARLPAELQLKIWDASYPQPGIHIFDVHFQPRQDFPGADKMILSETADDAHTERIFLDSLAVTPVSCQGFSATQFRSDPSTYRIANTLSATSIDSVEVAKARLNSDKLGKSNIVHLDRNGKRVSYDNSADVLCLRFGLNHPVVQGATNNILDPDSGLAIQNNISRILQAEWSEGMAASLFAARRLAIDISELWSPSGFDSMSIMYLSCCIQNDLEVLYLVDYCIGRCRRCWKGKLTQKELATKKCGIAKELDPEDRDMDVIYGSTVTYREISNLEKLGWDFNHSMFAFAQILGDSIREQQGTKRVFRSVRVLACEEEVSNVEDMTIYAVCIKDDSRFL